MCTSEDDETIKEYTWSDLLNNNKETGRTYPYHQGDEVEINVNNRSDTIVGTYVKILK